MSMLPLMLSCHTLPLYCRLHSAVPVGVRRPALRAHTALAAAQAVGLPLGHVTLVPPAVPECLRHNVLLSCRMCKTMSWLARARPFASLHGFVPSLLTRCTGGAWVPAAVTNVLWCTAGPLLCGRHASPDAAADTLHALWLCTSYLMLCASAMQPIAQATCFVTTRMASAPEHLFLHACLGRHRADAVAGRKTA